LGSEEFRRELLAAAVERVGLNHYGSERQETGIEKAQRIIRAEIARLDGRKTNSEGRARELGQKWNWLAVLFAKPQ